MMTPRSLVRLAGACALASAPALHAQAPSAEPQSGSSSWTSRVAVGAFTGQFRFSGNSEAFRLFDQALSEGTSSLAPRLTGGSLQVRVWRQASVVVEAAGGQRTVQSYSLAQPAASSAIVPQQTRLELQGVQSLGVQWQAWQWRRGSRREPLLTLHAGAGIGSAQYTLRQWGDFVDASRLVRFTDDLRSNGRGNFTYLSGAAAIPLTRWAGVRFDVRQQYGSAAMNGDFSSFDDLDLSGVRFGAGITLNASAFSGRR